VLNILVDAEDFRGLRKRLRLCTK